MLNTQEFTPRYANQAVVSSSRFSNNSVPMIVCNLGKGVFRPSLVYKHYFSHMDNHAPCCLIWKSKCQSKHNFFAWLLLHDRINTREMLFRRGWKVTDNYDCVLCPAQILEDWRHLFFTCQFSSRVWNYLQITWVSASFADALVTAKKNFTGPCFMEIVILACWGIWKQRNNWIFKNIKPTFRGWKVVFCYEVTLLKFRVKEAVVLSLSSWLDNLF